MPKTIGYKEDTAATGKLKKKKKMKMGGKPGGFGGTMSSYKTKKGY